MNKQLWIALAGLASMWGCNNADTTRVGPNELGVTDVEITRSSQDADSLLTIRGLDAAGNEVGVATVHTGKVLFTSDPDIFEPQWFDGRELKVTVGASSFPYINPSFSSVETAEPAQPALAAFVRLSAVSETLFDEAGFRFTRGDVDASGELTYAAENCKSWDFPKGKGGVSECEIDETLHKGYHKIAGGAKDGFVGYRTYTPTGLACRNADASKGCVGAACAFGPCTAKVEWAQGYRHCNGGANAGLDCTVATDCPNGACPTADGWVFTPVTLPASLGYDARVIVNGQVQDVSAPELYVAQALKPAVAPSCACDTCDVNGMPSSSTGDVDCDTCRGLDPCPSGTTEVILGNWADANVICGILHHVCVAAADNCSVGNGPPLDTHRACVYNAFINSVTHSWCPQIISRWFGWVLVYTNCS